MQIDRRITNGLAWAGAALVIGIPTIDFAMRQFTPEAPRAGVVAPAVSQTETPAVTGTVTRPDSTASSSAPAPLAPAETQQTASASNDPVDQFVRSGRPLPSYISDGGSTPEPAPAPSAPTTPAPAQSAQPRPAVTTPAPVETPPATAAVQPTQVTPTAPRVVTVTMPTPVSQRPSSRPSIGPTTPPPVVQAVQPPLVLDDAGPIVTAEDLDDWESGPLNEFLANRGQGRDAGNRNPPSRFDSNGFFLDEYYSNFDQ